jgi:membrane associated rhomboid family serine protease
MTVPARRTSVSRTGTVRSLTLTLKSQVVTLSVPLGTAWITLGINAMLGGWLNRFGIIPRSIDGLRGILFAPFLHGNLAHLTANSLSFLVLGWLVLATGRRNFARVSVLAALGSGVTSWVLGAPNSVHIGASGVIFGYLGYLMLSGVFARKFSTIALSVAVTAAWGAMVWGVLPGQMGVSWQGHLGGFVGGVLAARWIHARSR